VCCLRVAYVVDALPNVLFDVGEMYASLVPIDMNNTSRALYFVSQPTVGAPVDEITIWLNSRPGSCDTQVIVSFSKTRYMM